MAFAFPVFNMERLAGVRSIFSAKSPSEIFRFAIITSKFTIIGIDQFIWVYGLKAKVYLWDEKHDKAAEYARKAIDAFGGTPVTAEQWEDEKTGFNTANQAWMWYINYSGESMGNLANFTGWMSAEADWGYSSLTKPGMDRSLYDKIANTDFRKNTFLNPDKFAFHAYKTSRDADFINSAPAYLGLKFRCKTGDWETYSVGGAVDVPVMRVEEMYLIEAEAVGIS